MSLLQDLKFAVRLLVKERWFTVVAALVLALGIGANNAVFTLVNAVLLRSLPFPKPEQIMFVGTRDAQARNLGISMRDFEDWQAAATTFSAMSFVFAGSFNVGDEGRVPEQFPGATSPETSSGCSECHRHSDGILLPRRTRLAGRRSS